MKKFFNITVSVALLSAFVFNIGCASVPQQNNSAAAGPAQSVSQDVQQQQASTYYTGDGGKGMRLGILVPQGQGLSAEQNYLPAMVQGVLVSNISKYSAISVLDRVSLDKVIAETENLAYQDNPDIVQLGKVAQVGDMMTGTILQTSTGYALQINVSDTTNNAKTIASYSAACTVADLDNHAAIQKASMDLLTQMGVTLTQQARQELGAAAAANSVIAQTALAKGITAQKQGTEVAALSYYFQASTYDSSLAEAANRSSILNANISSGNIGNDVRNDIQWRKDWVARLTETEQYFSNFNQTQSMPYTLFYTNDIKQGTVDYQKETVAMSIDTYLHGSDIWTLSIERALQAVYDGLNATGRKDTWGLGSWPQQGVTNLNAFAGQRQNFSVVFELLNNQGRVIGRQTLQTGGSWGLSWSGRPSFSVSSDVRQPLNFQNVNANDISDSLTIRVASVNGTDAETAARYGILQIRTITKAEVDANDKYRYSRGELQGFANSSDRVSYLIIPDTIWGDPVVSIGKEAFANKNLTNVLISSNVSSIGEKAFSDNQLTTILIPNSVTYIGDAAFRTQRNNNQNENSYAVTSISIGANVTLDGEPFGMHYNYYGTQGQHYEGVSYAFRGSYIQNNMKAGTYNYIEGWIYDAPGKNTNVSEVIQKNKNSHAAWTVIGVTVLGGLLTWLIIDMIQHPDRYQHTQDSSSMMPLM
ncbi:MAG: leucine-rich repeat domain-containing protein [Treponema sp.]|nr:leucine-rich repeat domain-containing protein [Treponema sp.]